MLELRPLVPVARILDGELVRVELRLELAELVFVGLVDADPDEMAGLGGRGSALVNGDADDSSS